MRWWLRRHVFCYSSPGLFYKDISQPAVSLRSGDGFTFSTVESIDPEFEKRFDEAIYDIGSTLPFTLTTARQRLARAQRLIVAECTGDIAGWAWFAAREVHCDDFFCSIQIRPGQSYVYNVYVRKKYRGRELASRLLLAAEPQLRGDGLSAAWAIIYEWNIASQKAFAAAGYRKIGCYRYLNVMGIKLHGYPALIHPSRGPLLPSKS